MNQQVETIKAEAVGMKFGNGSVLAGGTWYNISKNARTPDGEDLTGDYFDKGKTYSVIVEVSEAGKKYIKGIASTVKGPIPGPVSKAAPTAAAADERMSKEEWSAKDKRISKQGFLQNALKAVVAGGYTPELEKAEELALLVAKRQYEAVWGEQW